MRSTMRQQKEKTLDNLRNWKWSEVIVLDEDESEKDEDTKDDITILSFSFNCCVTTLVVSFFYLHHIFVLCLFIVSF